MTCAYSGLMSGMCELWEKGSSLNPEGADENGYCIAEDDEDPSWCQDHQEEEDAEVCDYCGEPLGFCAEDCETLDEDFEE